MAQVNMQNKTEKKIEQALAYGYTPVRAICEFPDNILTDVENVIVRFNVHNNRFTSICISDDSRKGFNGKDLKDAFDWASISQSGDTLSRFGIGCKSASVNLGNRLELFCSKDGHYCYVDANWNTARTNDSLVPKINEILQNMYSENHLFKQLHGSTFIISDLIQTKFKKDTIISFEEMVLEMKAVYNYMLTDRNLKFIFEYYPNEQDKQQIILDEVFDIYKEYKDEEKEIVQNLIDNDFNEDVSNMMYYECNVYIKEVEGSFKFYLVENERIYEAGKKIFTLVKLLKQEHKDLLKELKSSYKKIVCKTINLKVYQGIQFYGKGKLKKFFNFTIKNPHKINKRFFDFYGEKCVPGGEINLYFMNRRIGVLSNLSKSQDSYFNYTYSSLFYDDIKLAKDMGLTLTKSQDNITSPGLDYNFEMLERHLKTKVRQDTDKYKNYYKYPGTISEYLEIVQHKKKLTEQEKEILQAIKNMKKDSADIVFIVDDLFEKERLRKLKVIQNVLKQWMYIGKLKRKYTRKWKEFMLAKKARRITLQRKVINKWKSVVSHKFALQRMIFDKLKSLVLYKKQLIKKADKHRKLTLMRKYFNKWPKPKPKPKYCKKCKKIIKGRHKCPSLPPPVPTIICEECKEEYLETEEHECVRITCEECKEEYLEVDGHECPEPPPDPIDLSPNKFATKQNFKRYINKVYKILQELDPEETSKINDALKIIKEVVEKRDNIN